MDNRQKAAAAILAARRHNAPYMLVVTDPTDEEWESAKEKAQQEHPLQEIHSIRVSYE